MTADGLGEFLGHTPCPKCGSSDAGSDYERAWKCFSCDAFEWKKDGGGGRPTGEPDAPSGLKQGRPLPPSDLVEVSIPSQGIPKRGLRRETIEHFGYGLGTWNGSAWQVATYRDEGGAPVGQKLRGPEKRFAVVGTITGVLFGRHLCPMKGRAIGVTEGEIDAMALSQALYAGKGRWPAVSIPNGAQSAAAAIKANLEFLMGYERVVLMFDNDDAGRAAAAACAELLPGRACIATLPLKDACDMVVAGRSRELKEAFWNAPLWSPPGIIAGDEVWQRVAACPETVPWLHSGLQAKTGGARRGEVVAVAAGTSIGKSTVLRQWAVDLARAGHKVGYLSLEDGMEHGVMGMAAYLVGRPFHLERALDVAAMSAAYREAGLDKNVVLYDDALDTSDSILSRMHFMAAGLDCEFVVLDHLSYLLYDEADNSAASAALKRLGTLAKTTSTGIITAVHLRKTPSTEETRGARSFEQGRPISLDDILGTGAIKQVVATVIALERDAREENSPTNVRVLKCRKTGRTGLCGSYRWDPDRWALVESQTSTAAERAMGTEDGPGV